MIYLKLGFAVWFIGFIFVFSMHIVYLQMVTLNLALIRSIFWPIYVITGWPHGTQLPMD